MVGGPAINPATPERMKAMIPTTATSDLRVDDLMTIDPFVVAADASIEEAEGLLRRHHISGLPVVNADGRLVGVISQTDLLHLAVPAVQALIRHHPRGIRIGEVMSTPPVTIDGSATLLDAARTMNELHLHRLVAVDDAGRPIGVISAMDFVALVAEG
jgi:CBS domain-containing protein